MIVKLPGGSLIDVDESVTGVTDAGGEIRLHVPQALGRLIAYWHDKQNMRGWISDYITEIQELENAVWDVIVKRTPDYAGTAQLDALGRLVGEERDGLGNADYVLRIKARIKANSSLGTGPDIIDVIKLITSSAFNFRRDGVAAFSINFQATVTDAAMRQLPGLIADTRAAGVGAGVSFTTDDSRGAKYGTILDVSFNDTLGYGSVSDAANAPLYGHYVRA